MGEVSILFFLRQESHWCDCQPFNCKLANLFGRNNQIVFSVEAIQDLILLIKAMY